MSTRGALGDWLTQQWVKLTGRRVSLDEYSWLQGPVAGPAGVGRTFFHDLANREGWTVRDSGSPRGLLESVDLLAGPTFNPIQIHPAVRAFYEQPSTSSPNSPSSPSPAHERLAVFEGTWIRTDSPPNQSSRDTCTWLAGGRRHMICRRLSEAPNGTREQMMIYSYRGRDSTYTVAVLLAGGQVWSYGGRPEGDSWVLYAANTRSD